MHTLRPCVCRRLVERWLVASTFAVCLPAVLSPASAGATDRETPIVKAVRGAAPATVNIQGHKSITDPAAAGRAPASREVNGMGTGVVIDSRGYILTNHHVVDGVRQINVTLDGGQAYVAQLIARDPETDLAIIRIRTPSRWSASGWARRAT
jgi:serine protease Do